MTIISLAGWQKSGKTRVADLLVKEKGFVRAKFASPLKRIIERTCELKAGEIENLKSSKIDEFISREKLAIEILIELGLTRWSAVKRVSEPSVFNSKIPALGITPKQMLNDLEMVTDANSFNMTYRELLQKLGTEIMRNKWDKEIHVNLQEEWLNKNKNKHLVYDDVRFPNEIALLKKYDAKVYWLHRPALVMDDFHESECSLGEDDCDEIIISREGTLLDNVIRDKF